MSGPRRIITCLGLLAVLAAALVTAGPASAAAVHRCFTGNLTVSLGPGSGTAGATFYALRFRDVNGGTCVLGGYPGVALISAAGHQIGTSAVRVAAPRPVLTLHNGTTVHAVLEVVDAANFAPGTCHPVTAARVGAYAPGAIRQVRIPAPAGTRGCASASVHLLFVRPVTAGAG